MLSDAERKSIAKEEASERRRANRRLKPITDALKAATATPTYWPDSITKDIVTHQPMSSALSGSKGFKIADPAQVCRLANFHEPMREFVRAYYLIWKDYSDVNQETTAMVAVAKKLLSL